MKSQSDIQRLTVTDIDAILALWQRADLSHRPRGRDRRDNLERRIESGRDYFFGIFDHRTLVAVILATHDGRKGWINRLAVDPAYRRRGMARLLIAHAEEHLRSEQIEIIAALIEGYNQTSLKLFQQCGYNIFQDIYYLTKRNNPDV